MPPLARRFALADLLPYFRGEAKHFFYKESVEKHEAFKPHSEGRFPAEIIKKRRPNEPEEVFKYREEIWEPVTEPPFSRIMSSLGKIRRSQDWVVKYQNNSTNFTLINPEETLEQYCEEDYPNGFTSLTNWVFSVCLKEYATDANAVIFVRILQKEEELQENEYKKPFPFIFNSADVFGYEPEVYAILNDAEGAQYRTKGNKLETGKAFYVVTTESVVRWVQVDAKGTMDIEYDTKHGLGYLPVFKLGGVIARSQGNNFLYESRIKGVLAELNEAVREYSDLQASKVTNIYHERWEFTNTECAVCKGTTMINNPKWYSGCPENIPMRIMCSACEGKGVTVPGPYAKMLVKPAGVGQQQLPLPPAGYIEKDTKIVELMDTSFRNHIFYALSAINFQFLEQTPLNESGKAKEVDKDELNNTVHAIAEDLIHIMDSIYKITADYRYSFIYADESKRKEMLPNIPVPEKYDLLSSSYLLRETTEAKNGKLNPVIVNAIEIDYANKRFGVDDEIRKTLSLVTELDPFSNISEEDKTMRLSNKGITLEAYTISCNINEFVKRALAENKEFEELPLEEQKKLMLKYAEEVINKTSSAKKVINELEKEEGASEEEENLEDNEQEKEEAEAEAELV